MWTWPTKSRPDKNLAFSETTYWLYPRASRNIGDDFRTIHMLFCHMGIFFAWLFQDFLIDCISVDKSLGTTLEGRSILLEVWEYKPAKPSQGDGSGPGEFERLQTGSQPRLHQEAGYHLFKWLKEKKDFNIIIFHSSEIQKWKALKPLHLKTSEAGEPDCLPSHTQHLSEVAARKETTVAVSPCLAWELNQRPYSHK